MKILIFVPSKILSEDWIRCKFLLFLQLFLKGRSNWGYSKGQSGCLVEEVASIVVRLSSHYFHSPKGRGKYLSSPEAAFTQTKLSSPLGLTDVSGSGNSQGHRNQMCADTSVVTSSVETFSSWFPDQFFSCHGFGTEKTYWFLHQPQPYLWIPDPIAQNSNIFPMCFSESWKAGLNWSWLKCEAVHSVVESLELWWSMTVVSLSANHCSWQCPKCPKWQLRPLAIPTTAEHEEKWWLQVKTCVLLDYALFILLWLLYPTVLCLQYRGGPTPKNAILSL